MDIRNEVALLLVVATAALVGCTKPQPVAPPEPPPVPAPPALVDVAPIDIPNRTVARKIDLVVTIKMVEQLVRETNDADLRNWLMTRLRLIKASREALATLQAKAAPTRAEQQEMVDLAGIIEELARTLNQGIERTFQRHRVNFLISDKTDLKGQPLEDLKAIAPFLEESCAKQTEIHVVGWGCARGPVEATQEVSDDRATNVANWIENHYNCTPGSVRRGGEGVHTPDEPNINKEYLEDLRSKHRFSEILVKRDSELPAIDPLEEKALPAGTLVDSGRTYDNSALGFRISIPQRHTGWHILPEPEGNSAVSVLLWGEGGQVQVFCDRLSVSTEVPAALEQIAPQIRQTRTDRSVGYREINGRVVREVAPAFYELEYESLVGSSRMRFRERFFLHGNDMIMVVAIAAAQQWDGAEPAFQEVLDSFVIAADAR